MVPWTLQSGSLDQLKDLSGLELCGTFLRDEDPAEGLAFRPPAIGGGGGPVERGENKHILEVLTLHFIMMKFV